MRKSAKRTNPLLEGRIGSVSVIRRARRMAKSERARGKAPRRVAKPAAAAARTHRRSIFSPSALWLRMFAGTPSPARAHKEELPGPWRIKSALIVLCAAFVIVLGRSVQLQIIDGSDYAAVAERQATGSSKVRAKRGVIKDRHGSELAITVDVDSVFAEPRKIEDVEAAVRRLAPVLGQKPDKLRRRLASERSFVYLARRVDPAVTQKVKALGLRGVSIMQEPKRFYTNVGLGAHVLGFIGADGEGKAGVERSLEESLEGRVLEVPSLRDALGRSVATEAFVPDGSLEGADVVLTIDREIQHTAETALRAAAEKYQVKGGVAIVIEPKTGDILALASWPTYNPNNLKGALAEHQLNRTVSAVIEPGSTMKLVTIAAALEEGVVKAEDKVDCEGGRWKVGGRTIGDSNHAYGELTIAEVLKVSSNICAAKVGIALGADKLHDWLFRFGFGEKTGVELPAELRGLIRPAADWRTIALANIAFGQGISVTPLQIAQAFSTIANGGVRMAPRLVSSVEEKSGARHVREIEPGVRVLSEATSKKLAEMMVEVTLEGGTAPAARIPGFSVAGKTGTAQKIDPVTKAYSHELYVSSFAGFVPAERPEVAVLVLLDEPKGAIYGGVVAAPAFREIAVAALAAREVFPEDPAAKQALIAQASTRHAPTPLLGPGAKDRSDLENLTVAPDPVEPEPEIEVGLSSEAQALLGITDSPGSKSPAGTGASADSMPNFAGLTLSEVLHRCAEVRCDPVVLGTGRVVAQTPAPGAPLAPGQRCEMKLAPKG